MSFNLSFDEKTRLDIYILYHINLKVYFIAVNTLLNKYPIFFYFILSNINLSYTHKVRNEVYSTNRIKSQQIVLIISSLFTGSD